jgi:adenosylcobinamide kinase / adenosylcobinamide-phosphate guanylyltransferase
LRVLALGGIRSGKSAWAEGTIAGAGEPVRYIATGAVSSEPDWAARVSAHRDRRPADWSTVETQDVAGQLTSDTTTATLVDDIGGWLVAAMDRREAWTGGSIDDDVGALADAVAAFAGPLALVSPEVGLSVVPATTSGRLFADALGDVNQRLAAVCDRVVLVIAGVPMIVKETP